MANRRDFSPWIKQARRQVEQATRGSDGSGAPDSAGESMPLSAFLPGYELVRELARGGQGVVYLARQQGTKRLVAVKIVREGPFSSAAERGRFEREVEILGQLKHAHIVTIHDSGEALGCSYFVMDYIEGPTLDDFIQARREPGRASGNAHYAGFVRDTLRVFVDVCDAVHAAHLRGIIHRDLKPSNIRMNEAGEPQVLDFGLAKFAAAVEEPASGPTWTTTGQFVGTINYASPEQMEGRAQPVDLRSDVYALGVILYELLTGHWPYATDSAPTVANKFDVIRAAEPRRPQLLMPHLEEDVEIILMKCLSKQPERRYQSAGALADDLRHVLAAEPIAARRDSALYVLRKSIRRHRAAVAVAGAFILLLVGATAVMTVLYERERQAHDRATRHYHQVRTLAEKLVFDLDDRVRPLAGSTPVRQFLVATGLDYLDYLAGEDGMQDDQTLTNLATAYMKTGDVQGGLSTNNLGDTAGASASYHRALEIVEALQARDPGQPRTLSALANAHIRIGDMHVKGGVLDQAQAAYREALSIAETLPGEDLAYRRLHGICLTKLGDSSVRRGHLDEAMEFYEAAREVSEVLTVDHSDDDRTHIDLAVHEYKIASVLARQGATTAAMEHYEEALRIRRTLLAAHPDSGEERYAIAELKVDIADLLTRDERYDEALRNYREALATTVSLAATDPYNLRLKLELALIHERIGGIFAARDAVEETREHVEASLELREQVVAADPRDEVARRELAVGHEKLGNLLSDARQYDDALEAYAASLAIREDIQALSPSSHEAQRDVAVSHFKIGAVHGLAATDPDATSAQRLQNWRLARERYDASLAIVRDMQAGGRLAPTDAGIPGMLEERIDECVRAIAAGAGAE